MKLGISKLWDDMKHRRYRFRQWIGVAFMIVMAWLAVPHAWTLAIGIPIIGIGVLLRLWAAGYIKKSQELEVRGPYGFVRHPQYLGNTLIAVGFSVASGHLWGVAAWALVFYVFYLPAIEREDEKLHRRFGEVWEEWKETTPAVFPLHWPRKLSGLRIREWSAVRAVKNGEILWVMLVALMAVGVCL